MDDITQCMVKRINSVIGLLFAFRDLWKECSENTTRCGDMFEDINGETWLYSSWYKHLHHQTPCLL